MKLRHSKLNEMTLHCEVQSSITVHADVEYSEVQLGPVQRGPVYLNTVYYNTVRSSTVYCEV